MAKKNPAAVALGRMGGKKLAEKRGPEWFKELQAKRKKFAGGRPAAPRTKKQLEAEKQEYERLYGEALKRTLGDTLGLERLRDAINRLDVRIKGAN